MQVCGKDEIQSKINAKDWKFICWIPNLQCDGVGDGRGLGHEGEAPWMILVSFLKKIDKV